MATLKSSKQTIEYQAYIDGLRAIAVLLVVVFHAHEFGVGNGFVGVDIFFVISGYLINSIIIKQNVGGEWSLWNYTLRRLGRIVPALLVTLALCLLVFLVIAPPGELIRLARDTPSAALFYSNRIFADSFGYFSRPAEWNPLVHTWSLSIEAQLYALFGVLGVFYGQRLFPTAVLTLTLGSLGYFLVNELNDVYFSLGARIWEFGLGGIVAYLHARAGIRGGRRTDIGLVLALLGCGVLLAFGGEAERKLVIIVTTMCFAALILFLRPDSRMQKLFSWRPLVYLGTISYSVYLLHQPIYVAWRHWSIPTPGMSAYLVLIGITLVFSAVSYQYVERPFLRLRHGPRRVGEGLLAAAPPLISAVAIMFLAVGVVKSGGYPERYDLNFNTLQLADRDKSQEKLRCEKLDRVGYPEFAGLTIGDMCIIGDRNVEPSVIIWGDSHADMYGTAFDRLLRESKRAAFFLRAGACPPILNVERIDKADHCSRFNRGVFKLITTRKSVDTVVFGGRFALYVQGRYDNVEGGKEFGQNLFVDSLKRNTGESRVEAVMRELRETLNALQAEGKKLVLLYPVPEVGLNVPMTLTKTLLRGHSFTHSYEQYWKRQADIINALDTVEGEVFRILPDTILCARDSGRCAVQKDRVIFYHDDNHLTATGAEMVLDIYIPALEKFLGGVQTARSRRSVTVVE